MVKKKPYGICALTLTEGNYVDAHIVPKALTKPEYKGAPLLQSTKGKGHKKRFSSWYDKNLVTREGEDILAEIDDAGIKALRTNQLIWSSWTFYKPVFDRLHFISDQHSIRRIRLENSDAIHRFFVSIAWRACASKMSDMQEAVASPEQIELMRQTILAPNRAPESFPVSLTQMTSKGVIHNSSPYTQDKAIPPISDQVDPKTVKIVRIYCDGLIAHVHLDIDPQDVNENPLFVGTSDKTIIIGIDFEVSYQYENLLINAFESYHGPSA
ncbi:hypothetical protein [Celeribacter halophilus]|uniref:hypothetical protein n=1 Tax=Celeribacter halophilus TaxID=576117 RepID=UPI003A93C340